MKTGGESGTTPASRTNRRQLVRPSAQQQRESHTYDPPPINNYHYMKQNPHAVQPPEIIRS
jgi:hypothetical protein